VEYRGQSRCGGLGWEVCERGLDSGGKKLDRFRVRVFHPQSPGRGVPGPFRAPRPLLIVRRRWGGA